ncbi:MAG TPA: hypothetical protein VK835_09110 [Bacteroidia bacterium]|nr:hypothetical protein [Bacteroidia bacterium]
MKLSNIFGKKTVKAESSKIQKLEKNQLSNVVGGGAPLKGIDVKLGVTDSASSASTGGGTSGISGTGN